MYGFCADPNIALMKSVSQQLGKMPLWLYLARPTNSGYHNLCEQPSCVPKHVKRLLGLGLNFCLAARTMPGRDAFDIPRFKKDAHTKLFFAGDESPMPRLFVRTDWQPKDDEIPKEFRVRIADFTNNVAQLAGLPRPGPTNLLPSQSSTLRFLREQTNLLVCKADKNLGPCIIEKDIYIRRALDDHLRDAKTYSPIPFANFQSKAKYIRGLLKRHIKQFYYEEKTNPRNKIVSVPTDDGKYLLRLLDQCNDNSPFAIFYVTMKVHKTPFKTRPISSYSGSLLYGLGKVLDDQLQRICRHIRFVIRSSRQPVDALKQLGTLPPTARFFTMDAVSMYTNIKTSDALRAIENFLALNPDICTETAVDPARLMAGLRLLMCNSVIQFGDTLWLQRSGTAMGAPPAPMYATLFFYIWEEQFVPKFPELTYYGRLIDDGLGLWNCHLDATTDAARWTLFQTTVNDCSTLTWEFSQRSKSCDFLDVTFTIDASHNVSTTLYEKAMNLYLYLPPHSAHPPGMLKGLVAGYLKRVSELTTSTSDQRDQIARLFRRLRQRGYTAHTLQPIFKTAWTKQLSRSATTAAKPPVLVLHNAYHPGNISSRQIQQLFRDKLLEAPETPLPQLRNFAGTQFGIKNLIVSHHRPRNLGNILSPRKLRTNDDAPVSSFLR